MQLLQLKEIEVAMKSFASVVNGKQILLLKKKVHYLETEAFIINKLNTSSGFCLR